MKRMKRVLFLLLAFSLLAGIAACGAPTTPAAPTQTPGQTTTATQAPPAQPPPAEQPGEFAEHIQIEAMLFMTNLDTNPVKDDHVTRYLMEKFNITLYMIETGGESAWIQRAPALIAGGDLPDIYLLFNMGGTGIPGMMRTLIDANAIENLEPWLEGGHLPTLEEHPYMQAAVEFQRSFISPDGTLRAIPAAVGSFDTPKNPVVAHSIRWEIYEEIGTPEITDMFQFLDVLEAMQEAHPVTPDGQSVYAVGGWFGDAQGWNQWCVNAPFDGPRGVLQGSAPVFQRIDETSLNQMDNFRDPSSPFYERLKWLNQANRRGLLDPDSWVMMQDNWIQKVDEGRLLYIQPGWEPSQRNPVLEARFGPDVGFVSLPPFPDVTASVYQTWHVGGERYYGISAYADEAVKERLLALCNWVLSEEGSLVMINGPRGMAWDYDASGKAIVLDPDYATRGQYDNDMREKYGANIYTHFKGFADGTFLPGAQAPANLRFAMESVAAGLTVNEAKALAHFNAPSFDHANYFGRVFNVNMFPLITSIPVLPEDLLRERTAINDLIHRYQFEMIQARDDAHFDSIMAEYISVIEDTKYDDIRQWFFDHEGAIAPSLVAITTPLRAALAAARAG